MSYTKTDWQRAEVLSEEFDISPDLVRQHAEDNKLHEGMWLFQKRPVPERQRVFLTQKWQYRALRLGTEDEPLAIHPDCFTYLAKMRSGHRTLKVIREWETSLVQLAGEGCLYKLLDEERQEAIKSMQEGYQGLVQHEPFSELPVSTLEEFEALAFSVTFIAKYEYEKDVSAHLQEDASTNPFGVRRLLIVGGHLKDHHLQQIRTGLELSDVDWDPLPEKNPAGADGLVRQVENGKYDAVVLILRMIRHQHVYNFKAACKTSDTLFVPLSQGHSSDQIYRALEHVTGTKLHAWG